VTAPHALAELERLRRRARDDARRRLAAARDAHAACERRRRGWRADAAAEAAAAPGPADLQDWVEACLGRERALAAEAARLAATVAAAERALRAADLGLEQIATLRARARAAARRDAQRREQRRLDELRPTSNP
jgi:flagellar biosynthesis chaperone FliJ